MKAIYQLSVKKLAKNLHALAGRFNYVEPGQRRCPMKTYHWFNYCQLGWFFRNRKSNNRISRSHEGASSNTYRQMLFALHKKWSSPLRIFSVNVTQSTENCGFFTFTKGIRNGKRLFLYSVVWRKNLLKILTL